MSLNEEERSTLVALEYEKAQAIYSQIEGLRTLGYWDNIANRLYYALFHAVSALLIHDKHEVNTHRGIVAMFGRYYVKTGLFTLDDGRLYSQLQTMREKGDYNCFYQTTEEEVLPMIEPTHSLIERISKVIQ